LFQQEKIAFLYEERGKTSNREIKRPVSPSRRLEKPAANRRRVMLEKLFHTALN